MDPHETSGSTSPRDFYELGRRFESTLTLPGGTKNARKKGYNPNNQAEHVSGDTEIQVESLTNTSKLSGANFRNLAGDDYKPDEGYHKRRDRHPESTAVIPSSACLLLEKLPGELRTSIYEYVFREPSATIVVDLRKDVPDATHREPSTANLILACKQIHKECGSLRYAINRVHIFVPILSASSNASQEERERRDWIASRLQAIADSQTETRQIRRVRLFLGRLPRLSHLRWTEFFSSWMSIKNAVVSLSELCSSLEISFEVHLISDVLAQHRFTIGAADRKFDTIGLTFSDGSAAEVTELERERMRRIKATITKTIVTTRSA